MNPQKEYSVWAAGGIGSEKKEKTMNHNIIDCPAMHALAKDYPERFRGRVPKTIRMVKTVIPDRLVMLAVPAEYDGLVAEAGGTYLAWTNSHGAVCAVFPDNRKLGVKPDEFEVVTWY